MKKILLLSQFFFPDKTGTGKILAELFSSIDESKFTIDVIASRQIYGDKTNSVLPSYEKLRNINIYRVFSSFKSKESAVGRLYNYIMFFVLVVIKVFSSSLYKEKDIIISVSNPPIMPLFAAWLKRKNNKVIYILHDLYPDIAVKMGVVNNQSIMAKVMGKINEYVFSKVDVIVVLGRDMKKYLMDNYQVPEHKVEIISNWANQLIEQEEKAKFRIVYSGNLGRFHNLDLAVKVVKECPLDVELIFIGEGAQKKYLMDISRGYNNIKFMPFMDDDKYRDVLNSADALLVSLEKNLSGLAVPSKFYTYLSAGKPIISISEKSTEMAMIIDEYNCGFVVGHDDVEMLKQVIEKMSSNENESKLQGNNALELFQEKYNKSIVIKKYEKLFESLF